MISPLLFPSHPRFESEPVLRLRVFRLISKSVTSLRATEMASNEPTKFLYDLLGKTLHISVLDGRRFTGELQ